MILLALLFVIVGVAGPQFGSKLQQVKKKGVELMLEMCIRDRAEKVTAAVPAKKEAVKTEAETMVTTIKDNLAATRTLLAKAPRGKEGRAAITQITGELNVIETRVKEVEAALREDINYAEALDRLNACLLYTSHMQT